VAVLRGRIALAIAAGGVLAFTVGLVLLVLAARADPVDAGLADVGRGVLASGLVATVAGTVMLAWVTTRRG
jgi:type IV secretory pathway TrbD component